MDSALSEGSIEVGNDGQCLLRCPWHGWDFDPKTGRPPGGYEDSGQRIYPVDVRIEQLESALSGALVYPGPALVEIITDADLIWPEEKKT